MNKARRKEIETLLASVRAAHAVIESGAATLSSLGDELDQIVTAEQDALDALPEAMQAGEKGEKMQTAIDSLESVADLIRSLCDSIDEFSVDEVEGACQTAAE